MDTGLRQRVWLCAVYCAVFVAVAACLWLCPPPWGYVWEPWFINMSTAALYTLLVGLTARLSGTSTSLTGVAMTSLMLALFCPGAERFFLRDEAGLLELASQCMVPFFIMQYMSVSHRNFGALYFLMLLMGVFCSYTHNSVTVPLCATFVVLAVMRRGEFFHLACWPMVVGFAIGTGLSVWRAHSGGQETAQTAAGSEAVTVANGLWDTRVIVVSVAATAYLYASRRGRRLVRCLSKRHYVLSMCLVMSWLSLPFAPLGIDNAVGGVGFFSLLWALVVLRYIVINNTHKLYLYKHGKNI